MQTAGCAPLARAWGGSTGLRSERRCAAGRASCGRGKAFPTSLAHGILDDETYDWFEVVKAMRETGGEALVADEAAVERAFELVRAHTGVPASATGAAGLAGALAAPCARGAAAVLSGIDRDG